jgi:hypothetical protein
MRIPSVAAILALCLWIAGAHAQTIGVSEWAGGHAASEPTPSWYGNTGLVLTPTAVINSPLRASGCYHRVNGDVATQSAYDANVALTSGFEVGVARLTNVPPQTPLGGLLTSQTVVNAKLALDLANWFKVIGGPDVAVGVWDATNKVNRAFYVVASKQLTLKEGPMGKIGLHLGLGSSSIKHGMLDGVFGGVDLEPFDSALVQLEYDANHFNADLRYFP